MPPTTVSIVGPSNILTRFVHPFLMASIKSRFADFLIVHNRPRSFTKQMNPVKVVKSPTRNSYGKSPALPMFLNLLALRKAIPSPYTSQ